MIIPSLQITGHNFLLLNYICDVTIAHVNRDFSMRNTCNDNWDFKLRVAYSSYTWIGQLTCVCQCVIKTELLSVSL